MLEQVDFVQIREPEVHQIDTRPVFHNQAFDLNNELTNYKRELSFAKETEKQKVNEAFRFNLEMFVAEYLSPKNEFEYKYYFNENNELQSDGWSAPARENYQKALAEEGIDYFTYQIRQAEYQSFEEIQNLMQLAKTKAEGKLTEPMPTKAILQSPLENHPGSSYSFVSFYELEETENQETKAKEYKVKVRNRKVYPSDFFGTTADQHSVVRDIWLNYFNNRGEQTYTIEKINSQDTPLPINILSSIIALPESANFDDLLEIYGKQTNTLQDEEVKEKLKSFGTELEEFFKYFSTKQTVDDELEQAFKVLLIKAKVHFDEVEAKGRWGEENVENIKFGSVDMILAMPLVIAGSCGNLDLGSNSKNISNASVSDTINALHTFSMPWDEAGTYDSVSRPDPVICSCGCKWYVKNDNPDTYKHNCPNPMCKKPMDCNYVQVQTQQTKKSDNNQ